MLRHFSGAMYSVCFSLFSLSLTFLCVSQSLPNGWYCSHMKIYLFKCFSLTLSSNLWIVCGSSVCFSDLMCVFLWLNVCVSLSFSFCVFLFVCHSIHSCTYTVVKFRLLFFSILIFFLRGETFCLSLYIFVCLAIHLLICSTFLSFFYVCTWNLL